jgi:hypothetical protein
MERALMTQHRSPDCYTFNVEVMSSKSAADFRGLAHARHQSFDDYTPSDQAI